jgi:hypothetical protein
MVEVFYEQLNFEMLRESEAYGVSIYEKRCTVMVMAMSNW